MYVCMYVCMYVYMYVCFEVFDIIVFVDNFLYVVCGRAKAQYNIRFFVHHLNVYAHIVV